MRQGNKGSAQRPLPAPTPTTDGGGAGNRRDSAPPDLAQSRQRFLQRPLAAPWRAVPHIALAHHLARLQGAQRAGGPTQLFSTPAAAPRGVWLLCAAAPQSVAGAALRGTRTAGAHAGCLSGQRSRRQKAQRSRSNWYAACRAHQIAETSQRRRVHRRPSIEVHSAPFADHSAPLFPYFALFGR